MMLTPACTCWPVKPTVILGILCCTWCETPYATVPDAEAPE